MFVIDCDPGTGFPASGIDDGFAVLIAMHAGRDELLGITTVDGNVGPLDGARALTALGKLTHSSIASYPGASQPLERDPTPLRFKRRDRFAPLARALWEAVPEPEELDGDRNAIDFLVDTLSSAENPIDILAIGPLTNIATVLQVRPELAAKINELVCMGGRYREDTRAEFNFMYDPDAAEFIIRSGLRLTLLPREVTERCALPTRVQTEWRSLNILGKYLYETTEAWRTWVKESWSQPEVFLHDAAAALYLVTGGDGFSSSEDLIDGVIDRDSGSFRLLAEGDEGGYPVTIVRDAPTDALVDSISDAIEALGRKL